MQFYVRRGREEDADKDWDEMRSVENCRLTHPTVTSLSIFHTLMTRQRKAAKGAKGDREKVLHGDDEQRLNCNVFATFPKRVLAQCMCACEWEGNRESPAVQSNPNWNQGLSHAKCFQVHCTIFAHIESGNFDNLRNLNVLMNCNILKLRILWAVCNFASFCLSGPDWRIETGRGDSKTGRDAAIKELFKLFTFYFFLFSPIGSKIWEGKGTEIETKSSSTASCGTQRLAELCFKKIRKGKSSRDSQGLSHFEEINVKFAPKLTKDVEFAHMMFIGYCNDKPSTTHPNQTLYHEEIQWGDSTTIAYVVI